MADQAVHDQAMADMMETDNSQTHDLSENNADIQTDGMSEFNAGSQANESDESDEEIQLTESDKIFAAIHDSIMHHFDNDDKPQAYHLAEHLLMKNIAPLIRAHCLMVLASNEEDPYMVHNAQEALRLLQEDCRALADDDIYEAHVLPDVKKAKDVLKKAEETRARKVQEETTAAADEDSQNVEERGAAGAGVAEGRGGGSDSPLVPDSQAYPRISAQDHDQPLMDDELLVEAGQEYPNGSTQNHDQPVLHRGLLGEERQDGSRVSSQDHDQPMMDDELLVPEGVDADEWFGRSSEARGTLPPLPGRLAALPIEGSSANNAPGYLTPISLARTASNITRRTHSTSSNITRRTDSSNSEYAGGLSSMFDNRRQQQTAPTSQPASNAPSAKKRTLRPFSDDGADDNVLGELLGGDEDGEDAELPWDAMQM